jgi:uncharacterized protein (TIGR00369 family)
VGTTAGDTKSCYYNNCICNNPFFQSKENNMSNDVREQWLEQERAIRERIANGSGWGPIAREAAQGKSGEQMFEMMLQGQVPAPPIGHTMDFILISANNGEAVFQGVPQAKHLNPLGGIHGGWYATLLDSAVGCAIHTLMPPGRGYTTAELSVNLVRAAKPDGTPLRAIGKVLHAGKQLATAEGKIVGPDGKLYAHATTTCLVFEMPA